MAPKQPLTLSFSKSSPTTSTSFLIDPLSPPITPHPNTSSSNSNSYPFSPLTPTGLGGGGINVNRKIDLSVNHDSKTDLNGLAFRLREATSEAHHQVMQPVIVSQLMSGQLPLTVYVRYLMMLHCVYSTLETSLSQSKNLTSKHLSTISNPLLLSRSESLSNDIDHFLISGGLGLEESSDERSKGGWKGSQIWKELERDTVLELENYLNRLRELGSTEDDRSVGENSNQVRLLAHAYVRYLGDLSGGQQIARSIRKSYSLSSSTSSFTSTSSISEGSSFYDFYLPSTSPVLSSSSSSSDPISTTQLTKATPTEIKLIKEWFRTGLDSSGKLMTELEIDQVVKEAKEAYWFNLGLFDSLSQFIQKEKVKEDLMILRRKKKGRETVKEGGEEWKREKTGWITWIGVVVAFGLSGWIGVREWGV